MRKRLFMILCIVVAVLMTGCTKVIDLSDDENRAIAEYSAELLLKHATGYDSKYFEGEQTTEEVSTEQTAYDTETETTETVTTEAVTTEQPVPEAPADTTEAATEDVSQTTEETISYELDVARILGLSELSIIYRDYQITERYPSVDKNGEFIYLDAPAGMKLIVVEFDMQNLTDDPLDVNLLDMDVEYRIIMNQSKSARQILTILMNDLATYEATLAPSSASDVVLVFQISDSLVDQVQTLDIKVQYNESEGLIKVL